ncbi:MAG TPA: hypothetical protein VEY91_06860 [Candidatus Limnocylindria bacterium]|nr:hypothetical protein [Candidatus Limnocylindria bacterium]
MKEIILAEPTKIEGPDASIHEARVAMRRRGRPLEMSTAQVLERILQLAGRNDGLFRVHRTHSSLYARARRQFGSWAKAVQAAGIDYRRALTSARQRSIETRKRRRRRRVTP